MLWLAYKSNEKCNIRQITQILHTADAEGYGESYGTVKDRSKYKQMQKEEKEETSCIILLNWLENTKEWSHKENEIIARAMHLY